MPHPVALDARLVREAAAVHLGTTLDHGGIRLEQFLSLSVLLEAVVLHEELVTFQLPQVDENGDERPVSVLATEDPLLGPLVTRGVLRVIDIPWQDHTDATFVDFWRLESRNRRHGGRTTGQPPTNRRDVDPVHVTNSLDQLRRARNAGMSFTPGLDDQSDFMLRYAQERGRTIQPLLIKAYAELDQAMAREIADLRTFGRSIPVYIPPITGVVLEGARDLDVLANVALRVRDEMAETRNRFVQYESVIRDDDRPLRESLSAARSLQASMEEITKPHGAFDIRNIEEWKDMGTLIQAGLQGISTEDANGLFQFVVGKPAKEVGKYLKRREVLHLAGLRKRFLEIREYGSLLRTKLRMELTSEDFSMGRIYLSPRVRHFIDE